MGLFTIFKKKKRKRRSRGPGSEAKPAIRKIEADMANLQAQIGTINIALKKHDDELSEHMRLISEHTKGLEKLEEMVENTGITLPVKESIAATRPVQRSNPSTVPESTSKLSDQKFDVNRFSEQEKRILSVFFRNKGTRLSYVDVAGTLNKSAHTVKNQMRQIRQKADMFDRTVGNQCRNLFKLKDDLRIEKYLNVGQPIERPPSTTWTAQSSG